MRRILIALTDLVVWIGVLLGTGAGIWAGGNVYPRFIRNSADFDLSLGFAGGVAALVLSIAVFGSIAALLQIEENTRRNSELFGMLVRRAETSMGAE